VKTRATLIGQEEFTKLRRGGGSFSDNPEVLHLSGGGKFQWTSTLFVKMLTTHRFSYTSYQTGSSFHSGGAPKVKMWGGEARCTFKPSTKTCQFYHQKKKTRYTGGMKERKGSGWDTKSLQVERDEVTLSKHFHVEPGRNRT